MSAKSIILLITIFLFTSTIHSQEQSIRGEVISYMIAPCHEYLLENNKYINETEVLDISLETAIEDIEPYIDFLSFILQDVEPRERFSFYETNVLTCAKNTLVSQK